MQTNNASEIELDEEIFTTSAREEEVFMDIITTRQIDEPLHERPLN